jgi:hypothetical protein
MSVSAGKSSTACWEAVGATTSAGRYHERRHRLATRVLILPHSALAAGSRRFRPTRFSPHRRESAGHPHRTVLGRAAGLKTLTVMPRSA